MTEPTQKQKDAVDWLEDPNLPTPTAEEAARRFREAGLRSTQHATAVVKKVKDAKPKKEVNDVATGTQAGGKPNPGTPKDGRLKENKGKGKK